MLRKHYKLTKKELKKDPFVIFMAQTVDFLKKESIKIISTVIVIAVVFTLAFLIVKGRKKGAVNAYDAAFIAMSKDAPEALDLLENAVKDYGGYSKTGEATIQLGNAYFQKKDFDASEKYYKQYIDKFSNDPIYTFNAYNGLGGIYADRGEFQKAAEIYEQFISKNKNSPFLPIMCLNAGKEYIHAGQKEAAKRNFLKISESFKDSKFKEEVNFYLELLN